MIKFINSNYVDTDTGLDVTEMIKLFSDLVANWANLNFNQQTMLFEIAKEIIYSANKEDIFME